MEIVFYIIFLLLNIAGAKNFYSKRNGWWLSFCILNIAIYFCLILNFLAPK